LEQGINVTDACKAAGVQHLIFSSLIDVKEVSKGSLAHVYHFDGKAEIERYIRGSGVPATFVLAGTFTSEMHRLINRQGDAYVLALPVDEDAQIPLIDVRQDMGKSSPFKFIEGLAESQCCVKVYSSKRPSKTNHPY
jgi:uncharacterized protein YbjT (DUF2867 family)